MGVDGIKMEAHPIIKDGALHKIQIEIRSGGVARISFRIGPVLAREIVKQLITAFGKAHAKDHNR